MKRADLNHDHHHQQEQNFYNANTDDNTQQLHTSPKHDMHLNYTLSEDDLLNICPVLLYQLSSVVNSEANGCIQSSVLTEIESMQKFDLKEDIFYGNAMA